MPYYGCTKCHHEWEGSKEDKTCDWCGAKGRFLEKETAFERFVKTINKEKK